MLIDGKICENVNIIKTVDVRLTLIFNLLVSIAQH